MGVKKMVMKYGGQYIVLLNDGKRTTCEGTHLSIGQTKAEFNRFISAVSSFCDIEISYRKKM